MSSDPQRPDRPIFALDENFPEPLLLDIVRIRTPELDLRHVRTIDARLRGLLDHRLILALFQSGVEGLVTNDDRMIFLPEVLAIIQQTGFTVVTCRRTGHDPLVATGLLLVHLGRIARRHDQRTPQVWRLTAPERPPEDFAALVRNVEDRTGQRLATFTLTEQELEEPVL